VALLDDDFAKSYSFLLAWIGFSFCKIKGKIHKTERKNKLLNTTLDDGEGMVGLMYNTIYLETPLFCFYLLPSLSDFSRARHFLVGGNASRKSSRGRRVGRSLWSCESNNRLG
jgi:hypothetical protein